MRAFLRRYMEALLSQGMSADVASCGYLSVLLILSLTSVCLSNNHIGNAEQSELSNETAQSDEFLEGLLVSGVVYMHAISELTITPSSL